MVQLPIDTSEIVITSSRAPEVAAETPASITIINPDRLERIGDPQIAGFLRLVPSAAVSTSGPMGSITEVRIRGAEANHSILFIDGIRANDPAESNTPRFELLNADMASRIEVIRGPQSALWGSEAIGGVVAVDGRPSEKPTAFVEAGSLGFFRGSAGWGFKQPTLTASLSAAFQRSDGINNYARVDDGERDGFRNLALRGRAEWQPHEKFNLGINGFALSGSSEFDGYDPITFNRADTLDNTRNRLAAARLWARYNADNRFYASAWASWLTSSNRNFLGDDKLNRTHGVRGGGGAQVETRFATGAMSHRLIGAAELEREAFEARDFSGGFTNQDRDRNHAGLTAEWRAQFGEHLFTDLVVRNDRFNRFKDATTLRASALVKPVEQVGIGLSYGEGIAQPTFTELYGFFPGGFSGNPDLRPERSRGVELTASFRSDRFRASGSLYRHRLQDEILTLFFPVNTAVNSQDSSKRKGAEIELGWTYSGALNLTATYAFLDATQPTGLGDHAQELRRPKHSGSVALDGRSGGWTYGASLAFTGAHRDQRDEFPYELVQLGSYWLSSIRVAYAVRPEAELFARVTNAFDARYQDVVGYRTEGRGIYAGIRLAPRS